jgi:imidazolonepropionase-like amidohydrolase
MFQMTGGTNTPKVIAHLPDDLAPLKHWKNDKGKKVNYAYSNFDILRMITANNGQVLTLSGPRTPYLGADGHYLQEGNIGVIREGAVADLLVVEGNPFQSLDMFYDTDKNLLMIMKDGVIYKNTLPDSH